CPVSVPLAAIAVPVVLVFTMDSTVGTEGKDAKHRGPARLPPPPTPGSGKALQRLVDSAAARMQSAPQAGSAPVKSAPGSLDRRIRLDRHHPTGPPPVPDHRLGRRRGRSRRRR